MKACFSQTPGLRLSAILTLFLAVLVCAPGCEKETDVGGPGAVGGQGGDDGKGENTFNLTLPSGAVDIQQGGSQEVTIGFEAGEVFDNDPSVKVEMTVPENITVEPAEVEFNGDKKEAKVTISVSAEARTGKHNVVVIGKPRVGETSEGSIVVNVTEKEENE